MIRVVDVRGLRTPEQRAGVVYVGRAFAGWPESGFGNPFKPQPWFDAVAAYRSELASREQRNPEEFAAWLFALWALTYEGEKPLGCWCGTWHPEFSPAEPEFCHAIVLAKLLNERFGGGS